VSTRSTVTTAAVAFTLISCIAACQATTSGVTLSAGSTEVATANETRNRGESPGDQADWQRCLTSAGSGGMVG
jgi:hypothetical protein